MGSPATHQDLRQLLHPSSIYPAPPSHCQAPGILGSLEPVKPSLKAPALQVLPPNDQEHQDLSTTVEEGRAKGLGLFFWDPTGMRTGQRPPLSQTQAGPFSCPRPHAQLLIPQPPLRGLPLALEGSGVRAAEPPYSQSQRQPARGPAASSRPLQPEPEGGAEGMLSVTWKGKLGQRRHFGSGW